ncbi:hypothetical protein [Aquimarina sp. MMG016]|uniref:hypothetical protein n=1 Tax=Aquimarina sp. MMG016 TaxID=2822690 RepID=UPI001B3A0385|nr:hypothetical protein [Aquimarina sp. MMG016]MBQ4818834.1 hypothetical protein [Aquimarina sp. MMG016]
MEREELIDKFLQGTLAPEEKDNFNRLLDTDPDFKNDFEIIKDLNTVSGSLDREDLKKVMNDFETKIANNNTKIVSLYNYKKLLVAASIVLIVAIGAFSIFNPFVTNPESLYAENFEPYRNVVTPIVRGENSDNAEIIAFTSYESKNFETAASQLGELFSSTNKPHFLLYQANSLMALDKTEEAIPLLEKHIEFNDQLVLRSKWYLALAYLKKDQKAKSVILLKDIVKAGSFKQSSAEALLKKLD